MQSRSASRQSAARDVQQETADSQAFGRRYSQHFSFCFQCRRLLDVTSSSLFIPGQEWCDICLRFATVDELCSIQHRQQHHESYNRVKTAFTTAKTILFDTEDQMNRFRVAEAAFLTQYRNYEPKSPIYHDDTSSCKSYSRSP